MKKIRTYQFMILFILYFFRPSSYGQMKTEEFTFTFDSIKYSGFINLPANNNPTSMVIIVSGSGKTKYFAGNWIWFNELFSRFAQQGIASCVWDKAGCGKSEGKFDEKTVQNSSKEVLAAIEELKRLGIPGSDKIGLWGISRAGWICPLVIEQYPSIVFWISVSGADEKDNLRYLLESNFRINGRSESETRLLMAEWDHLNKVLQKGGETFDELKAATKHLFQDPYYKSLGFGEPTEAEDFYKYQKYYQSRGFVFDEVTGLQILVPGFKGTLNKIQCPVLAIFGEKDFHVDWRKTVALYKETIGRNSKAELTIKTFPDCNHIIQKCETGGNTEDLKKKGLGQPCDGFFDTMLTWLKEHRFTE
jgi:pimeloyl-ACP methyl ester carboxylesterase